MNRWIILDRDGVINQDSPAYIKNADEWKAIPKSLEAIALLNKKGYFIAIATNQSGIARGYYTEATLKAIHEKMLNDLETVGGKIERIFYCPHGPEAGCDCRKPLPGLLKQMAIEFNVDLSTIPFVGDSYRDIQTAVAAHAIPVLVRTGNGLETLEKHAAQLSALGNLKIYDDLWNFAQQTPEIEK